MTGKKKHDRKTSEQESQRFQKIQGIPNMMQTGSQLQNLNLTTRLSIDSKFYNIGGKQINYTENQVRNVQNIPGFTHTGIHVGRAEFTNNPQYFNQLQPQLPYMNRPGFYNSGNMSNQQNDLTKGYHKNIKVRLPGQFDNYEGTIVSSVKNNQVTIISVDACYFASETIPYIIHKMSSNNVLQKGIILSCHPNAASTVISAQKCKRFFPNSEFTNIISYETGKDNKVPENTEIFFRSVQELYCESIVDPTFSSYAYIIFHCEFKRCLETDFLLERLRNCTITNKKFKLIIVLSTLDDTNKFKSYFSILENVGTINVPKSIFPVQTKWKETSFSADKNYLNDVLDTALAIHIMNGPGDVIVFLPNSSDIQKVSNLLNLKLKEYKFFDVKCISVYESSTEQRELYFPEYNSQVSRKFFLISGWAELISLPTVAYVIDTGIKSNLHYDQVLSTNIMMPVFISKSRAELRKNYAGYFQAGICYRLYSKEDYTNKMPPNESSDLLLKDPLDVMLQMLHYNRDNVMSIDLIEPLSKEMSETAYDTLRNSNIITENELSSFGRLIVKLPYPTKYSKLIVLGFQWGYGIEAIVLTAFFFLKTSIFIYDPNNQSVQQKVEATKLQYSCHDSDSLTYLNIYRNWMLNGCDKCWCQQRGLDYHSLMKVKSSVGSIVSMVSKKLKEDVGDVSSKKDLTDLLEIMFDCFKENLCIFTGHYRSGYCLFNADFIAFLHPSCTILQNNSLPEYVIFDHLKITSRRFMMGVTCIPSKLVLEAAEKNVIKMEKLAMQGKKLQPVVMENVGVMRIKHGLLGKKGKKLFEIENQIKRETQKDLIVIEPSVEKGIVTLFVPPDCAEKVKAMMHDILSKELKVVLNAEEVSILELKKGPFKVPIAVTWQKGAVTVKAAINAGVLDKNCDTESTEDERPSVKYSINLSWKRKMLCKGYGYCTFNTDLDFSIARKLCMKTIDVEGRKAEVSLDKGHQNQLFISGLSEETSNQNLETAINKALKEQLRYNIQVKSAFIACKKMDEVTSSECDTIKKKLLSYCCECFSTDNIKVVVPKPDNAKSPMKAFINVDNSDIAETGAKHLNEFLKIDGQNVKAHPVYYCTVICSLNVFEVLKDVIESKLKDLSLLIRKKLNLPDDKELFRYSDKISKCNNSVMYKFLCNNAPILLLVQRKIQELLEGDILTCQSLPNLQKVFSHGGHLWLKALEKRRKIYVVEDYKTKKLRLYGLPSDCKAALQDITKYLCDVEKEVIKTVDLSTGKLQRLLMKEIIKTYGVDLRRFVYDFNLRSAELNIRAAKLVFYGSADFVEKATVKLECLAKNVSADTLEEFVSLQESCCTCGIPPVQSPVRLEHCGHLYCADCIKGLISTTQFPIQCCAENCEKDLILEDIHQGLMFDKTEIDALLNRSVVDYVSRNNQYLIYCPAPDCSMFFDRREVSGEMWTCKLCQNDICINCNVIFHRGYTCKTYKLAMTDPDYSLKIWLKDNERHRKPCPKCNVGIEKDGGCNHMTCGACNAHFCWLCLTAFPNADLVYDHQPQCPNRFNR